MRSLLIGVFSLILWTNILLAEPNPYEKLIIEKQVRSSFRVLMDTWKEELYFDLYDLGQHYSKKDLTLEEFAQRMVDLQWKPSLTPEKIIKLELLYRTFATVYCILQFEHKVNPTRTLKKEIMFPAILEDKVWKFDLSQLIRSPYIGRYYDPKPEKSKEIKPEVKTE